MLKWAIVFFVIALLAAILGFGGFVAGSLMWAAKVLFAVFIVLFVISLIMGKSYTDPLA